MQLEFARRPARRVGIAGLLLALVVAVVLTEAAMFALSWKQRSDELAALGAAGARAAPSARKTTTAKLDPAQLLRMRSAQSAARSLTTPWVDLLRAIESAPQDAVALLAFEPSAAKQTVRLKAEARDNAAMLAYLEALQHDPRLASVVLISHQLQQQAPGTPVRFQVQASWGAPN
jgi:Tfp pilus assembly protein PilN